MSSNHIWYQKLTVGRSVITKYVRYIFRFQKAKISTNVKTKRSYTKEVGNAKSTLSVFFKQTKTKY